MRARRTRGLRTSFDLESKMDSRCGGGGGGGTAGTAGLFPHHAMWGNTIKPQPLKNGRGRDSDGGAAAGASQETKGAAESKERHEEGEFPQH